MFNFFNKKEPAPSVDKPAKRSKQYFKGVAAIRTVPFKQSQEKRFIMSIYVPDAIKWLQEHQTENGWCNVNIDPMQDKNDKRSHVAYLNERLTPRPGTDATKD